LGQLSTCSETTKQGKDKVWALVQLGYHRVLDYGLNFSISLRKIPVKELLCDIENSITYLRYEKDEKLRQECVVLIKKFQTAKKKY
jgi:hypothetical protein